MTDFSGKVALVTGASRGIGRAAALALARQGAHVIALARTIGGLEELDDEIQPGGAAATLVPMDLKDFDAIDRLGAAIYERWGRLDILLGNGGILGALTPVGHLEKKVFEETMAVNLNANWRLLRSLDPLLRRAPAGRALFLTASAALDFPPFFSALSMSKAALEALVKTYAAEMKETPIRANLLDPGPLRTRFRAQMMPGEDASALPPPEAVVGEILKLLSADFAETGRRLIFRDGRAE